MRLLLAAIAVTTVSNTAFALDFGDFAQKLKGAADTVQGNQPEQRGPANYDKCAGSDSVSFYTLTFRLLKTHPEIKLTDAVVDKWWDAVPDSKYTLVKDDEFKVGEEREKIKKELTEQVEKVNPSSDMVFKFETDVGKYDMAKGGFGIEKDTLYADKGGVLRNPAHVEPIVLVPILPAANSTGKLPPNGYVFKAKNPEVFGLAKIEKSKAQELTRDNNRRLQFALKSKVEKIDLNDKLFPDYGVVYLHVNSADIYSDYSCEKKVGTLEKL